jgi:RNA polymerase sigma factor (sigma-70 family)
LKQVPTYELIRRKKKDGVALIYQRYGKKLFGYGINSWKLNEDEAWELIYKTLYKVVETTASYEFESEDKYASFIFKVYINYLRTHYRDKKSKPVPVEMNFPAENVPSNEEPETESAGMTLLKSELDKLEDWERMLLLLRSQDMPYQEIANYVNRPVEQLKVYYQRLKATIMKRMNEKLVPQDKVKKEPDEKP